jgi:hypothetical protein
MANVHGSPSAYPQWEPHHRDTFGTTNAVPNKPSFALAVEVVPSRHYQNAQISPPTASSTFSHPDSVISHPQSPLTSYAPSAPSIASGSIHNEKSGREDRQDSRANSEGERGPSMEKISIRQPPPAALRDPEKRTVPPASPTSGSRSQTYNADIERAFDPYAELRESDLQSKALRILVSNRMFSLWPSFIIYAKEIRERKLTISRFTCQPSVLLSPSPYCSGH